MKKQLSTETSEQGFDFWNNEHEYFLDAIEGLKMAHAVISSLKEHAAKKMEEFSPDREEVES